MKKYISWLGWVLLFAILWFRGCSHTSAIVTETKGVFAPQKPNLVPLENGNIQKSVSTPIIKQVENPINAQLLAENISLKTDFAKASDTIKKLKYSKAIQLNNFSSTFEDSLVKIDINGIVQGDVKQITPTYTIKQIPQKETVFRLLGGLEIGNNKQLSNPLFKANLGFQNRKGNVISVSYDNNKNFYLGYHFSIFDIKKPAN